MGELVDLVPKGAIERVSQTRTKKVVGPRLAELAKAQRMAAEKEAKREEGGEESELKASQAAEEEVWTSAQVRHEGKEQAAPQPGRDAPGPSAGETPAPPGKTPAVPGDASECLEVIEVDQAAVVVVWRLGTIEEWGAPVLGAACKDILGKKKVRKVIFDFSGVTEMSTAALSTLIRFKNTVIHLDKQVWVVAGPGLRAQLAASFFDRMIPVIESVAQVIGSELRIEEKKVVRDSKKPWWKLFAIVLITASPFGSVEAQSRREFPELCELEARIQEAPELRAIELEIQKIQAGGSWAKRVNLHTSYSQHFATYVPALSGEERKISGDTFAFGGSVSLSLDELLNGKKNRELEVRLKRLEYERLFQTKLAAVRVMYQNREKLVAELQSIEARSRTADLKLKRVQAGIALEFLPFTPIDLAEAEEAVARINAERRQTELDIQGAETRIHEVLGKGDVRP